MLRKDLLIHNTKMLLEGLAIAGFQSNSTKPGTSQKKPKSNVLETIDQDIGRFAMSMIMHREVEGLFR